ncbi:hypothetical protein GIS00_14050 [Nakamurella sp. YIM 132087]|uniref:Uncharacterized protein n=1 Tax=Nakamurella alba TaxID=2665158 RepID=A0A7K1FLN7_9ACTN|nr:hypothetical protein [Nakamurella alba]MTD15061.1 hypothetical protein [Nakamurella alba]
MAMWEYDGRRFMYVSGYMLDEGAWHHELSEIGSEACACIVIPDATPDDGPFTPGASETVILRTAAGTIPWPIWVAFMSRVHESNDLGDR